MRILLIFFIFLTAFSLALEDYGSFADRSVIMKQIYGNTSPDTKYQEQLIAKKLAPDHRCLFEQIKLGDSENVKLLLDAKVNPNQSYMGEHAIYIAAKENNFEIVKLLCEYGAKLDLGFFSELYEAVRNKNKDMAQFLLGKGARVNYKDAVFNNTILYLSLKNKMYDISAQLIEKGAKPDMPSVRYIKKHRLEYLIPGQNQP